MEGECVLVWIELVDRFEDRLKTKFATIIDIGRGGSFQLNAITMWA